MSSGDLVQSKFPLWRAANKNLGSVYGYGMIFQVILRLEEEVVGRGVIKITGPSQI